MNWPCCASSSSDRSMSPETTAAIVVPIPMIRRIVRICAGAPAGGRARSEVDLIPSGEGPSLPAVEGENLRRSVAEFVGAFALIFVGAGSVMTGGGDLLGVAVAHGLILAIMVTALGHISGGHFNPAVTLGFIVTRRIKPLLGLCYWAAQFSGAVAAALLLKWIYPDTVSDAAKLGAPTLNPQISPSAGFILEAILTFFLVWVVFATAADPRGAFT